jgi:ribulose-5-phosphate 4-epimerase/fuculose-1-phosphate aldolase
VAVKPIKKKSAMGIRRGVAEGEWQARVDLAACYQLIDLYGLTDLSSNHISVRIPGRHDHFLLNPLGILYDQITASSLLKVDVNGQVIGGDPRQINPAGFVIHSAVHMARPDLRCVLHTHTRATAAIGVLKDGLLPLTQKACTMLNVLSYHDWEGPSVDLSERKRLVRDIGEQGRAVILRNHGAMTVGRTVGEALVWMLRLETACRYQVDALSCAAAGFALSMPPRKLIERTAELAARMYTSGPMASGSLEWPSLVRKLERERGTSYRT